MAHYIQRLILAGLALSVAQAADFSHALHVKLKSDCTACHTKAATSTRLEDNLLPAAEACVSCHKEVSIKQPRAVRLLKFDHAFHVKLGNVAPVIKAAIVSKAYLGDGEARLKHLDSKNACAACHQGIESSTAVTAAKVHYPEMSDCLVCHNKIDPPFSCETCHGVDKTLKTALHTPDYLDAHTRKTVAKVGCASCHGRKFTCLGCH